MNLSGRSFRVWEFRVSHDQLLLWSARSQQHDQNRAGGDQAGEVFHRQPAEIIRLPRDVQSIQAEPSTSPRR